MTNRGRLLLLGIPVALPLVIFALPAIPDETPRSTEAAPVSSATATAGRGETTALVPLHKGYVSPSTGLYFREDDDLVVDGVPPISFRRTYQSKDPVSREFGIGARLDIGDPTGRTEYTRDAAGRLLSFQLGQRGIAFEYDGGNRIVSAHASDGRRVGYEYDNKGRLVRVLTAEGTTRKYAYNDRHQMLTIDEPGWFIRNWFDDRGRVSRQVTTWSDGDTDARDFAYPPRGH